MLEKKGLRKELLTMRNALAEAELEAMSQEILENLKTLPEWWEADVVYTYVSYGSEVNTISLIQECLKEGKRVAVPKVLDKEKMEFFYLSSLDGLKAGFHGILEPDEREEYLAGPLQSDSEQPKELFIMPGLGFDREFHRLGYGGGFYDRYLGKYGADHFIKVAISFSKQILSSIPFEAHDVLLDMIISEKAILRR